MKTTDTRLAVQPHYLIMLKLYIQPNGGLLVTMGNQRMEVSHDEVHALLCGTLDFANVFKALHDQVSTTVFDVLSENSTVNGNVQR